MSGYVCRRCLIHRVDSEDDLCDYCEELVDNISNNNERYGYYSDSDDDSEED